MSTVGNCISHIRSRLREGDAVRPQERGAEHDVLVTHEGWAGLVKLREQPLVVDEEREEEAERRISCIFPR